MDANTGVPVGGAKITAGLVPHEYFSGDMSDEEQVANWIAQGERADLRARYAKKDWKAIHKGEWGSIISTDDKGRFAIRPFRTWTTFPPVPIDGIFFHKPRFSRAIAIQKEGYHSVLKEDLKGKINFKLAEPIPLKPLQK